MVVIASWCGRKAKPDKIRSRPGFSEVAAVKDEQLYEIRSSIILQPGPAALTDGANHLAAIVSAVAHGRKLGSLTEGELRRVSAQDLA